MNDQDKRNLDILPDLLHLRGNSDAELWSQAMKLLPEINSQKQPSVAHIEPEKQKSQPTIKPIENKPEQTDIGSTKQTHSSSLEETIYRFLDSLSILSEPQDVHDLSLQVTGFDSKKAKYARSKSLQRISKFVAELPREQTVSLIEKLNEMERNANGNDRSHFERWSKIFNS
jgi:hypothetical protein